MTATLSTREVIEHGVKGVAAALNQRKPSAATIDAWSDLFADENPKLLAACFRRLAEESERFPTPRRMRSLLAEYRPSSNPALTHTEGFDANGGCASTRAITRAANPPGGSTRLIACFSLSSLSSIEADS